MIERKPKKCKGTGKAKGYGCGDPCFPHRYGLCLNCFKEWLFGTEAGKEVLNATRIQAKKKAKTEAEKQARKETKAKKEAARNKSYFEKLLQKEVNEIVRIIDTEKGCISCTHGWGGKVTRQFHAGHRISVGSNPTLRYHFSNIFKQCSICNNYKSGNERAFDAGILKIYGAANLDIIQSLPVRFKGIHLSIPELKQKVQLARRLKKEILNGKHYTRRQLNEAMGIYKHQPEARSSELEAKRSCES